MLFVHFLHLYIQSIHKIGVNKVQDFNLRIMVMALKCSNVAFLDSLILLKLFNLILLIVIYYLLFRQL